MTVAKFRCTSSHPHHQLQQSSPPTAVHAMAAAATAVLVLSSVSRTESLLLTSSKQNGRFSWNDRPSATLSPTGFFVHKRNACSYGPFTDASTTSIRTGPAHCSSTSYVSCKMTNEENKESDTASVSSTAVASSDKEDGDDLVQRRTWNPLRLLVLRLGLTEPAMTSPLNYGKYDGTFSCAYCGQELFDSSAKYDSGSGWPSFWRTAAEESVSYKAEWDGRLECLCGHCQSHLGHVFMDGPRPASVPAELLSDSPNSDPRSRSDTYLPRFCINGAALRFEARGTNES